MKSGPPKYNKFRSVVIIYKFLRDRPWWADQLCRWHGMWRWPAKVTAAHANRPLRHRFGWIRNNSIQSCTPKYPRKDEPHQHYNLTDSCHNGSVHLQQQPRTRDLWHGYHHQATFRIDQAEQKQTTPPFNPATNLASGRYWQSLRRKICWHFHGGYHAHADRYYREGSKGRKGIRC